MLRCRFYVGIEETDGDYRPMVWPVKYPYWCTGENETDFCIVAYVDSMEDLMKQWPEAHDIEDEVVDKIEFTGRFPKPDWYVEKNEVDETIKSMEKLIKNGDELLKELDEIKEGVEFLQNEYKTNKKYFRDETGKVTIDDVIKRTFEFAWAAAKNFSYKQ